MGDPASLSKDDVLTLGWEIMNTQYRRPAIMLWLSDDWERGYDIEAERAPGDQIRVMLRTHDRAILLPPSTTSQN